MSMHRLLSLLNRNATERRSLASHEDPNPPVNLAGALESAVRLADAHNIQRLAVLTLLRG